MAKLKSEISKAQEKVSFIWLTTGQEYKYAKYAFAAHRDSSRNVKSRIPRYFHKRVLPRIMMLAAPWRLNRYEAARFIEMKMMLQRMLFFTYIFANLYK